MDTLFDGVPEWTPEGEWAVDSLDMVDTTVVLAKTSYKTEDNMVYHKPYQEKGCAKCHDQQHLGELVEEVPKLCYKCHEVNFKKDVFQHGPSGAGFCTACHQPHKSKSDFLLLEKGNELCYSCHGIEDVAANSIHNEVDEIENCTTCHDPHASDRRFMIKQGACYECHDHLDDKEFTHGPVSAEYCSSCHDSHESKSKFLLVAQGEKLCLSCHDSAAIFKDELHKKEENKNCINCHDPHGGSKEFMLN